MTKTNHSLLLLATFSVLALSALPAAAQATAKATPAKEKAAPAKKETEAQLKAEAKITLETAKATALSKVPSGIVKSA